MDTKNIMTVMIVALVGAVILAGFLPVIGATQDNIGTPITKSNAEQLSYDEYGQYWDENVTFVLSSPADASSVADAIITVNDEVVNLRANFNRHIVLTSDNLLIEINTASSTGSLAFVYYPDENGSHPETKIMIHNTISAEYNKNAGTIRFVYEAGNIDLTFNATYCFTVSNDPEYSFVYTYSQFQDMYMSKDLMTSKLGGVINVFSTTITVGETPVSAVIVSDVGGTRVLYDKTVYAGEINAELVFNGLQLAEGTTDIYTGGTPSFNITADGETVEPSSLTPARSFIISEVSGHASAGALYDVYGILPLIVAVGLLMFAITAILIRRV